MILRHERNINASRPHTVTEHFHPTHELVGSPLQDKVSLSRRLIREGLALVEPESAAVAWTGGKDSTAVLHLFREVLRPSELVPVALTLDTGCKFPEVIAFRDALAAEWSVRLHVLRPEVRLQDYPLARDKVACCRELKIDPLQRGVRRHGIRLLLTGIRHDEHPSRAGRQWIEERSDPDYLLCNPILHWSEMDVWAYHSAAGLPYCTLYESGYRSLGCMPCTLPADGSGGERSGRSREKEEQLELLKSLGYF
jgi:phosphoadenosine phosphosulfate reductase